MEKGLLSFSYFGGRCLKKKPGLEFRLDANFKQSCINFTTQIKHILTEEVNMYMCGSDEFPNANTKKRSI